MNQLTNLPEPWLRGTLTETPAVLRAVVHAFQAAEEDLQRWCGSLTQEEVHQRPAGLASVAFHLRHIPGSVDRLLTYAEGRELSPEQMAVLKTEGESSATTRELLQHLSAELHAAARRVQRFSPADLEQRRSVGRKQLPTTVGGLLVHVADHTQRHVGQAITTAKLLIAQRGDGKPA